MIQEIVYTSAPRGLKPGSRGFCTVQSTGGMAQNLATLLESLSGYRQIFPPHDPQAAQNPIVHSHVRTTVGGKRIHVLSRICASGLDYTQRANKLAHHVALDEASLPSAGPGWLLARPGFMKGTWDGHPNIVPPTALPAGEAVAAPCKTWQAFTGHAGWGGVLAETALPESVRGAILIFKPGQDVLPLLAESLALLPPELRWRVTLSTYFTGLPTGIECQWRCVLAGSPEAKTLARSPGAVVLDLTGELGAPPRGNGASAAEQGVRLMPAASALTTAPLSPAPLSPAARTPAAAASAGSPFAAAGEYSVRPTAAGDIPPALPSAPRGKWSAARKTSVVGQRRRRSVFAFVIPALFFLVMIGLFVYFYPQLNPSKPDEVAEAAESEEATPNGEAPDENDEESSRKKTKKKQAGLSSDPKNARKIGPNAGAPTPGAEAGPHDSPKNVSIDKGAEPTPAKDATVTPKPKSLILELPEYNTAAEEGASPSTPALEIPGIDSKKPITFTILSETRVFEQLTFEVTRDGPGNEKWKVVTKSKQPTYDPVDVGQFRWTKGRLSFRWLGMSDTTRVFAGCLRNCALQLAQGSHRATVLLRAPAPKGVVELTKLFEGEPPSVKCAVRWLSQENASHLRFMTFSPDENTLTCKCDEHAHRCKLTFRHGDAELVMAATLTRQKIESPGGGAQMTVKLEFENAKSPKGNVEKTPTIAGLNNIRAVHDAERKKLKEPKEEDGKAAKEEYDDKLAELNIKIDDVDALIAAYEAAAQLKIGYRIYIPIDDEHDLDLVVADPNAANGKK